MQGEAERAALAQPGEEEFQLDTGKKNLHKDGQTLEEIAQRYNEISVRGGIPAQWDVIPGNFI